MSCHMYKASQRITKHLPDSHIHHILLFLHIKTKQQKKKAQCDHSKCQRGDVCVFIYSSHLVYEWTTAWLRRPAHILRNQPTTGYLPVQMCSQCTLSSAVDRELMLLHGVPENMEEGRLGVTHTQGSTHGDVGIISFFLSPLNEKWVFN